jgi:hypothetical protein
VSHFRQNATVTDFVGFPEGPGAVGHLRRCRRLGFAATRAKHSGSTGQVGRADAGSISASAGTMHSTKEGGETWCRGSC